MPRIRIGVSVGMTIRVGMGDSFDFVKPHVHAEVDFDEIPSDEELDERWRWIWETQIAPQSEQLLDLMQSELAKKLGPYRESPDHPAERPEPAPRPPAPAAYE
jgi:hypothetical protein